MKRINMLRLLVLLNLLFLAAFNTYVFIINRSGHSGFSPYLTYCYLIPAFLCSVLMPFFSGISREKSFSLYLAIILSAAGILNVWVLDQFHIFQKYESWIKTAYAEERGMIDENCRKSFIENYGIKNNYKNAEILSTEKKTYFFQKRCIQGSCSEESLFQTDQYLIRGDTVLVSLEEKDYSCTLFISEEGKFTSGWLKNSSFKIYSEQKRNSIEPVQWIGNWKLIDSKKEIKTALKKDRESLFLTGTDDADLKIKERKIWNRTIPFSSKDIAEFSEDGCNVKIIHFHKYLALFSEDECREVPSDFSGIYFRDIRFPRLVIQPVHDEKKDPEFFRFYRKLLKAVKDKDNRSLISVFSSGIQCTPGGGDTKEQCIAVFSLYGGAQRQWEELIFWEELEVILSSGGKKTNNQTFYFPSADFSDRSSADHIDYALALGKDIPVYKNKGKIIISRLSDEYVRLIHMDQSEWASVRTSDGTKGYVNKKFIRIIDGSAKRLIIRKTNGKWLILSYVGGI